MPQAKKDVEVSRDALGFVLLWTKDQPGGQREGEPVEEPMSGDVLYFKSKAAAQRAAKQLNETGMLTP